VNFARKSWAVISTPCGHAAWLLNLKMSIKFKNSVAVDTQNRQGINEIENHFH